MKTIEQRFRLQVPSSPENLSWIRDFVARVGAQAGMPEDEIGKLELADIAVVEALPDLGIEIRIGQRQGDLPQPLRFAT
jgi:anti-sigma regulatory factor (Ser/Thr protein kinase)